MIQVLYMLYTIFHTPSNDISYIIHYMTYRIIMTQSCSIFQNGSANSPPTSAADPPSGAHAWSEGWNHLQTLQVPT